MFVFWWNVSLLSLQSLLCFFKIKNQTRVLTSPSITGQAPEALWDKIKIEIKLQFGALLRMEENLEGKPPDIGCEGWKTSYMWPGIETGS